MSRLEELKKLVFASDNRACFIERDRVLNRLAEEWKDDLSPDKSPRLLRAVLEAASTPVEEPDYFAGRMVEALPEEGMKTAHPLICSTGHMSPDYGRVLRLGLSGILEEIRKTAGEKGDAESAAFARNAEIVVFAIRDYCLRYADAAEAAGKPEMARALRCVPFGPAYDFYSALQSVWMIHMVCSCFVGSRDYAFGRFDGYMLPYYEQALAEGHTPEELTELLAGFFLKTNEICGRATHNHACKPIRCNASKQYVNIGGASPNAMSFLVLEAAKRLNMAQPQITVLLRPEADEGFTTAVFEALCVLTDKMNIYHYDLIVRGLLKKGVPEEIAGDFTYSACCTFDLHWHTHRREYFTPVPQIFSRVLREGDYPTPEALLAAFREALRQDLQRYCDEAQRPFEAARANKAFVLDSLLLTDSALRCRHACDGESPWNVLNLFCPGVATVGDSLMVLDRLVFREKRYTFREFAEILRRDFEGCEALRQEILSYTRFGNGTAADDYTALAGNLFLDAVDSLKLKENFIAVGGFYSLERDNLWKDEVPATPDGRKAGTPFSENQSPTYGADGKGVTALLRSAARLPFERGFGGGLNLTFSAALEPEALQDLVLGYFLMGGLHVGITVLDRAALLDAMEHPENHPTLTVRLYGFSEYFISLPRWQQQAVLDRTANSGEDVYG